MTEDKRGLIILQGGEEVKNRVNKSLFKQLSELTEGGNILVVPWSTSSIKKEIEYRSVLENYFRECGFINIEFLEREMDSSEIKKKIKESDIVYLPGGDTDILWKEMSDRKMGTMLEEFHGIIVGNSAGAIVLSLGSWIDGIFYPRFGIVDFYVKVHFIPGHKAEVYDKKKPTLCIPEGMWISLNRL